MNQIKTAGFNQIYFLAVSGWHLVKEKIEMENYCLLTDATAELTPELAQELDVGVIPMPMDIDGVPYQFQFYNEKMTVSDFYNQLRAGKFAHTSQVNEAVYLEVFEQYLKDGKDIIYCCFSSGMSSTYNAACRCMEQLREKYPERRLVCIDSLCASAGLGLLVFSAAERKKAGMSMEELEKWVLEHRQCVCHCFKVDELEHLRRGGRISAATAIVGSALQIKPILVVDTEGKLQPIAKARGRKRALAYLLDAVKKNLLDNEDSQTLFIGHADSLAEANELKDAVYRECPHIKRIIIVPLGPIVGAHVGPGMIDILFYGKDRMCHI